VCGRLAGEGAWEAAGPRRPPRDRHSIGDARGSPQVLAVWVDCPSVASPRRLWARPPVFPPPILKRIGARVAWSWPDQRSVAPVRLVGGRNLPLSEHSPRFRDLPHGGGLHIRDR